MQTTVADKVQFGTQIVLKASSSRQTEYTKVIIDQIMYQQNKFVDFSPGKDLIYLKKKGFYQIYFQFQGKNNKADYLITHLVNNNQYNKHDNFRLIFNSMGHST